MATITAVVRTARINKNGVCHVELAISHKGVTRYVNSGVDVEKLSTSSYQHINSKNCLPFSNGFVTKKDANYVEKNLRIAELITGYTKKLESIHNLSALSIAELVKRLTSARLEPKVITMAYAQQVYADLKAKEGPKGVKNANMCNIACQRFLTWIGADLPVADVDTKLINSYREYLRNLMKEKIEKVPYWLPCGQKRYKRTKVKVRALSPGTIGSDLSRLKAVLNYQQDCKVNWHEIKMPVASRCDCDIEIDELKHYMSLELHDKVESIARDVWLLSFYLGGINYADLCHVNCSGDEIHYIREKTRGRTDNELCVGIPICAHARTLINKYITSNGTLDFGYHYSNKDDELRMFAQEYRDARFEYGMPEHFMFKSARHTFSQFASDLNLPERVTNYILAHAEGKSNIMYYYRKVKPKQVKAVMDVVFDYVDNPEKYAKVLEYTQLIKDMI